MVASPDGASLTPRSHPPPARVYICMLCRSCDHFSAPRPEKHFMRKKYFFWSRRGKKIFPHKVFFWSRRFFFPVIFFFCLRNVRKNAKKHSVALFFLFLSLLITILKCSKTFPMLSRSEKVNLGNITSPRPSASGWQNFPLIHFF